MASVDHSSCAGDNDGNFPVSRRYSKVEHQRGVKLCLERLVKWSLPPPVHLSDPLPGWQPMPFGLENFWASAFAYFFRSFLESDGHLWTLTPVSLPPVSSIWKWHQTSYSAKVRFHCSRHGGWTSVKGRALFWYRLRRQGDAILPEILFKLYGQQCNQCPEDLENFLPALWYYEEIENAVRHLLSQVSKTYYGAPKQMTPQRLRKGKPTSYHEPSRCQACYHGLCALRL